VRALETMADSSDVQNVEAAQHALARIRTRYKARGFSLGDEGVARIAATHRRLTWFDASDNGITVEGARAIARSEAMGNLATLLM